MPSPACTQSLLVCRVSIADLASFEDHLAKMVAAYGRVMPYQLPRLHIEQCMCLLMSPFL